MKLSKMTWFNATVAALCLFCGIYSLCRGNILMGILDIILAALNLYCVLNFIAMWWEKSDKVRHKFIFTCPKCDHKLVPNFWRWIFVPHLGSKRYFKCDRCRHYSWMKRKQRRR